MKWRLDSDETNLIGQTKFKTLNSYLLMIRRENKNNKIWVHTWFVSWTHIGESEERKVEFLIQRVEPVLWKVRGKKSWFADFGKENDVLLV